DLPRFIQTVPKVGYRFIAPVEEIHPAAPAPTPAEHVTTFQVEFEEDIEDTAPRALAPPPGRNRLIPALAVLLLVAAASLAAWYSARPRAEVSLAQFPGK